MQHQIKCISIDMICFSFTFVGKSYKDGCVTVIGLHGLTLKWVLLLYLLLVDEKVISKQNNLCTQTGIFF